MCIHLLLLSIMGIATGEQTIPMPELGLTLPQTIGQLQYKDTQEYGGGLGYSVRYANKMCVVSLYAYNRDRKVIPSGKGGPLIEDEMRTIEKELGIVQQKGILKNLKRIKGAVPLPESVHAKFATAGYTFDVPDGGCKSYALMTGYQNHFFKIRATQFVVDGKTNDAEFHAFLKTIAAFVKLPADPLAGPPLVSAKAWAIADGKTGKLLWGDRQDEPRLIASITKVMTAWLIYLLALENPAILDEEVQISEKAATTSGSTAGLKQGEKYLVRDLLHGLMLPSGNDAAVALAEHFGPRLSTDAAAKGNPEALFVAAMNRKAQALKMVQTKYYNPHGNGKNTSSAAEVLLLTWHALQNPGFARCVQTVTYKCDATDANGGKRPVTWTNTNRLLAIEGFDGVKTGTTSAAGHCLVSSGWHGKDHLLVVVLGSTSNDGRYLDTRNLFRWAWRERGHQPAVKTKVSGK